MSTRLGYYIKQAFSQMGRNKGMYFTSVLAITAMMLILGLFFVMFVNVNLLADTINENYNVVQVYVSNENDTALNEAVKDNLSTLKGVESIKYVSQEDALKTLKKRWGENGYLLDSLQDNPLPASYMVYVTDKDAANSVAKAAVEIAGVEDITYYQDTIEKLAKVTRFIEIGSIVTMVFLVIVSVIIVANTIKLTVFNRAKEIQIMKYLGATDSFVRSPFIIGGILMGVISSIIATGLIYLIYSSLMKNLGTDIIRILSVSLYSANYLSIRLLAIFLILGIGIGIIGSTISLKRFLKN